MLETTANNIVKDFDKTCDSVIENCEPIIIARENGSNVVLVSQADYNNMLENIYIRKSKANYSSLLESIEEARSGNLTMLDIGEEQ